MLAWNLVRGRIGRAMMAIRDHADWRPRRWASTSRMLKTRTFAVSAMYTGIAGSLGAIAVEFVAPDSFGVAVSISCSSGMVVGGVASILGSLFGGLFVLFVPNIAEEISKAAPGAIYGIILIAFLFILPDGFAGLLRRIAARLRGMTDRPDQTSDRDIVMTINRRALLTGTEQRLPFRTSPRRRSCRG